ncbi:MAG: 16S rRNA (uracil(1498)-N(3))-methyltransferase [Proteobacteria bacterium]|nr:16S rRNA (uracil(1498)-N(3))-methyltransferase [Pseudomonadota bacterium]
MTTLLIDSPIEALQKVIVEGKELHYLTRVRRHRQGDTVEVRDYQGRRFSCKIEELSRDRAVLSVDKELPKVSTTRPVNIIMAVPKRNLMDDVVRKVSEIGVQRLIPVLTERSVMRPGPAKLERWRKIAKESRRQCGRETPLIVDEVLPFKEALSELTGRGTTLILHTEAQSADFPSVLESRPQTPPLSFVIGPEGGFTDKEIEIAQELGFKPTHLGASILRTETAAITAAVLSVALLGGF